MENIYNVKDKTYEFVNKCESQIDFSNFDKIYEFNQLKVLNAFIKNKVSESSFNSSTGYGYNDLGRDIIENVYRDVFKAEDALVRQQIVSGTHAISLALFALTRPNHNILSINGIPYDTLHETLGIVESKSSLKSFNVSFDSIDLLNNDFNYDEIKNKILDNTRIVMIQRSRGYSTRYSLKLSQIKKAIEFVKSINKDIIILVDNCYGEFVNEIEPNELGADIICGSLIKNIGGGLAKSGGYIVGKKNLINLCAERLTAPGLGKEVGVTFNENRNVLQGLYLAPQIVYNSLKISKLFAKVLNELNIDTIPRFNESFDDIVLSIKLNNNELLQKFCSIIQSTSPVDSYLKPVSTDMPGYDSEVIMAAGCFVSGSSIELSCDAPMREPYMAFMQGGLTYFQGKYALMKIVDELDLLNETRWDTKIKN